MRRFYIPSEILQDDNISISGGTARHINNVLRLPVGEVIFLFDGEGRGYEAVITAISKGKVAVKIIRERKQAEQTGIFITVFQSLIKGNKYDFVVQKATELGVLRIIPVKAQRCNVHYTLQKAEQKVERWKKIAVEASAQCGRSIVPEIYPVCSFVKALDLAKANEFSFLLWEREEKKALKEILASGEVPSSVAFFVGPEGGFTEEEVKLARGQGIEVVSLGQRILRTETVALVVCSIIQFLWGDLGS